MEADEDYEYQLLKVKESEDKEEDKWCWSWREAKVIVLKWSAVSLVDGPPLPCQCLSSGEVALLSHGHTCHPSHLFLAASKQ